MSATRRGAWRPLSTGGPLLTAAFWATVAVFVVALWLSPVLTFGDYNYHLALASVLRRMASPGSAESQLYESNLFSYNSGFHALVAALSFVMPTPYAGLLVYTGFWVGFCLSVIALLRALKLPTERAFIVFPLFLSFPAAWGFVNNCVGLVIQLYVLARVIRRPRAGPVPLRYDVVTAILALLGLITHLFATAVVFLLVFVALLVRTTSDRTGLLAAYGRTLREGLAFIPSLLVTAAIFLHQRQFTSRYPDKLEDIYGGDKVKDFLTYTCDLYESGSDRLRLALALVLLLALLLLRAPPRGDDQPTLRVWLLVTTVLVYLLMPGYAWRVAALFHRIPMVVVLFFAIALPRSSPVVEKVVGTGLAIVAVWCAIAFFQFRWSQRPDLRDFAQVIAEAPARRRITMHTEDPKLDGQRAAWGGQLSAYYVAARDGIESGVSYASIPSNPVHYRGEPPPVAPDTVAQGLAPYDPAAPYAPRFDLVLVRTSAGDPAPRMWGDRAGEVELVSHHGRWWLFDARRYFAEAR